MQSAQQGSWNFAVSNGQSTPRSAYNAGHHREASLSSVGSAGPSSPYNACTSNPHIVIADSADAYYDGLSSIDQFQNLGYSKPLSLTGQAEFFFDYNNAYNPVPEVPLYMATQKEQDSESMPAPDRHDQLRPSLLTRTSTNDQPATPGALRDFKSNVPKLDRTMSDAYNDELYNPDFVFTSAPSSKPAASASPSQNDVFTQTLKAANSQHLAPTAASLGSNSRTRSPFRQGSPLAPSTEAFGNGVTVGSAQKLRQQQKAEDDARALAQQIKRSSRQSQAGEEKTISPKDALLDYNASEEVSEVPLFPPARSPLPNYRPANAGIQQLKTEPSTISEGDDFSSSQLSMATTRRESSSYSASSQATPQPSVTFAPPSVPGVAVPQQYPFVPQIRHEQSSAGVSSNPDFTPTLSSMESSSSEYSPDTTITKPTGTTADSGTYTCTYHGCTLRFETPAQLQKHKRSHSTRAGSPEAAASRNSQAGPHKCERINPSTGKPCNTIFSRPYDLTRHEDTIHNARKQKVRCQYCTEDKSFSRSDALTRHMRVVHPDIQFDARQRKKND